MRQLLGLAFMSFFCRDFLANVRIVLASTDSTMDLDKLADKVLEVATPTVATVSGAHPGNSEVEQL